ncbi:MAG: hypothetical protein JO021_10660 [Alphaproteobacteria bacterium]|nr:hypothetical protein [Alphaproteobacteria bacterium]
MLDHPTILTHDECVALSRLTDNETAAIATIPTLADEGPEALSAYLVRVGGSVRLSRFIAEDLDVAVEAHDHAETARLKLALQHFLQFYERAPRC